MLVNQVRIWLVFLTALAAFGVCSAQTDASQSRPGNGERPIDPPRSFGEMLVKQRIDKARREHDEMLRRGDEALALSKQLEESFAQNQTLSSVDRKKLESLEQLVVKIRKELGGDDDEGSDEAGIAQAEKEESPSSVPEAFKFLRSTTVKLVDELKKTTRYSISAAAIQSSNTVLKVVRFLRLRK